MITGIALRLNQRPLPTLGLQELDFSVLMSTITGMKVTSSGLGFSSPILCMVLLIRMVSLDQHGFALGECNACGSLVVYCLFYFVIAGRFVSSTGL